MKEVVKHEVEGLRHAYKLEKIVGTVSGHNSSNSGSFSNYSSSSSQTSGSSSIDSSSSSSVTSSNASSCCSSSQTTGSSGDSSSNSGEGNSDDSDGLRKFKMGTTRSIGINTKSSNSSDTKSGLISSNKLINKCGVSKGNKCRSVHNYKSNMKNCRTPRRRTFILRSAQGRYRRATDPIVKSRVSLIRDILKRKKKKKRHIRITLVNGSSKTSVAMEVAHRLVTKVLEQRVKRLQGVGLFQTMGEKEIENAAEALEVVECKKGDKIIVQGEVGDCFFVLDHGRCYGEKLCYGKCNNIQKEDAHLNDAHLNDGHLLGRIKPKKVRDYQEGDFFGERALLRKEPAEFSIIANSGYVRLLKLDQSKFVDMIQERDLKEGFLRNTNIFETLDDLQMAKLAAVLKRRYYRKGVQVMVEGETGEHLYFLERGELAASIKQPDDSQQIVFTYTNVGVAFGEKALQTSSGSSNSNRRAATVTVTTDDVVLLELSRSDFEKKLGMSMTQLKAEQYLSDPRKLIKDFLRDGNQVGPRGCLGEEEAQRLDAETTLDGKLDGKLDGVSWKRSKWFGVYRPCSRDSIAKMLGKLAVGKS